jgi:hypothetical protein
MECVRASRSEGTLALRALVVVPTWDGPRSSVRDHDVAGTLGELLLRDLPARAVVRVAVGYRHDDAFLSIAHAPALES